jgi:methylenetetrahydrofolate dehydrogenase (NADP+)/methenyltetrahydrofolate cyclohydrolase
MIISGKELATKLRTQMQEHVKDILKVFGEAPCLAVILVGDDPASQSYVKGKSKACEEIGIKNITLRLHKDTSEIEMLRKIQELNLDPNVHGILVQLPLPNHIDERKVMNFIDPRKDVDGFHPFNVDALYSNKSNGILPCTPKGIIHLLIENSIQIAGKHAVVIGRSNIIGLPIAKLLLDNNATVTVCHSQTKNLKEITRSADILVVAIGKPEFITCDMVNDGAVVIDVGVNRVDGKLVGDVHFDSIKDKASYITPVPGGVGPMTITCLMENTIECFLKQHLN